MSDPIKQAWSDVADEFSSLGRTLKDRYQAGESDEAEGAASAAEEAQHALRDVLDRLVAATRELGDRAGDVLHDDAIKGQAKHAVRSLGDALVATVDLIGEQIGGLFKPSRSDRPDSAATVVEVTAEPTTEPTPGPTGESSPGA
jgi:hypothetical protein